MWCLSCFKPSTTPDPSVDGFETDLDIALTKSRQEDDITRRRRLQEDEDLARAIQESSNIEESSRRQGEEEEQRQIEKDAQIAHAFQYEETEMQLHNKSALEDEEAKQLAKALEESLKEKRKQLEDEQVKKDGELAVIVQESLNMLESPPQREENNSISHRAPLNPDEQLVKALEESLKERRKGKQLEDEQVKKDGELAVIVQEILNMLESLPRREENNNISRRAPLNLNEQLAKALEESLKAKGKGKQFDDEQVKKDGELAVIIQESMNMLESPPRLGENNNTSPRAPLDEDEQLAKALKESLKGKGLIKQTEDEVEDGKPLEVNPPRSMCGGCNSAVEYGRSVNILGILWHPRCFCCRACDKLISIHEVENHVSNSRGKFHKSCYKRYCYVCKDRKMKDYNNHPFWEERYCKSHETDGTPKCCSCERLEPRGTNYVMLEDGRWLCLECMDSAVMDSDECQPLHFDMRDFFEGLLMKIDKQFPFLLVEKQALNKAEKEEKIDCQYEVVTRGICLSEAQTVTSVSKGSRMGPNKRLIGMATESQRVVRECEVTAILILYGLPRLLTGYILAHEMMHAYLRLNGYRNLNNVLEEGLCQVLGHMWLESQTYATANSTEASSSSSSPTPASKKGEWSDFEKKLVEFCKNQIETDESPVYGDGFRLVNHMVANSSVQETLKEILRRS